jgi:hypothetical protein
MVPYRNEERATDLVAEEGAAVRRQRDVSAPS